jgi:Competence protein CoiA-like family
MSSFGSGRAKLVYGLDSQGRIVHVLTVDRGLACNCRCPDPICHGQLVAKHGRGKGITPHFAHHVLSDCSGGPESALHLLAKQTVMEATHIKIPAGEVRFEGTSIPLWPEKVVRIDSCVLECREVSDGEVVVADLLIKQSETAFYCEIHVTHECDDEKIAKLQQGRVPCMEIDLSKVSRDIKEADLKKAVLQTAPRKWVYHPKIKDEFERLHKDASAKIEDENRILEARATELVAAYQESTLDLNDLPKGGSSHPIVLDAELTTLFGEAFPGSSCFSVPPKAWQRVAFELLLTEYDGVRQGLDPITICDAPDFKPFIGKKFLYITKEAAKRATALFPDFATPQQCLMRFISHLKSNGIVVEHGNGYTIKKSVGSQIIDHRRRLGTLAERRESVRLRITEIIELLPEQERGKLTFAEWQNGYQLDEEHSIESTVSDDDKYERLEQKISAVERLLECKIPYVDDSLGLPLAGAMNRSQVTIAQNKERSEQKASVSRRALLEGDAKDHLGITLPANWSSTPNFLLDQQIPVNVAAISFDGYLKAKKAMHDDISRHRQKQKPLSENAYAKARGY